MRDIELLGSASIGGGARDFSGASDVLADGTPHDRFGSFGSAIAWTGAGERYVVLADRGPKDGAVDYACRFHALDIHVEPGATPVVSVRLVSTTMLADENDAQFVGLATAFDTQEPAAGMRLDPEGVRASRSGTLFVSEEYGPSVCEVDLRGRRLRTLPVPREFMVATPAAEKEEKIAGNVRGRVTNKGFEGLAISPDGAKLFALAQAPLIQDHGREGRCCRMLEIELATQATRQLCVVLDAQGLDFNELLAIGDHEFLAIERDGEVGAQARTKKIVKLDIAGASDVSASAALPADGAPKDVRAVAKAPFIDLLDPRFGLLGPTFPQKIEGLAFGPDLADGRRLLLVTSDNDFLPGAPTSIWAFAIQRALLPGFRAQVFDVAR